MLTFLYTKSYDDGRSTDIAAQGTSAQTVKTKVTTTRSKTRPSTSGSDSTSLAALSEPPPAGSLLTNAKVYVIADKYDVQPLKELAKKKYEEVIPDRWNRSSFAASLKLLYEQTVEADRLLKDEAITAAGQHMKDLVDKGEFVALCNSSGEICFDVLKAASVRPRCVTCSSENVTANSGKDYNYNTTAYKWYCPNCNRYFD